LCGQGYAHVNLLSHLSGWVVKGCRADTSTVESKLWISQSIDVAPALSCKP